MTQADELSCQELVELVTDYIEGKLPSTDVARFEEHLDLCEGCVNYLEQMRRTIELTGSLTEESLGPEARDGLLVAFREWKQRRGPSPASS